MRLLIIGAGGFAIEVEELARLNGYDEIAFLDDNPDDSRCKPVIGRIDEFQKFQKEWPNAIVAMGNNEKRMMIHQKVKACGYNIPILVHPNSYISNDAKIGNGSIIRCFAYVGRYAQLGESTILNIGAKVDHDCAIGEGAHLLIGSVVRNSKNVEPLTWLDTNKVIE